MKTLITIVLCLVIVLRSDCLADPQPPAPQPKACLFCILVVIGVVVCGVMIYGLWKMCKNIPGPPPSNTNTNAPPTIPPSPAAVSTPAITMAGGNGNAVLQSSADGTTWATEATFTVSSDGTNAVILCFDAGSNLLAQATSAVYTGGKDWPTAVADFSRLNLPGHPGPQRFYRMVSAQ